MITAFDGYLRSRRECGRRNYRQVLLSVLSVTCSIPPCVSLPSRHIKLPHIAANVFQFEKRYLKLAKCDFELGYFDSGPLFYDSETNAV